MTATTSALAADSGLWPRLLALDLDGAAQLSFSKRLARDNGWPVAFAQRTVLEYKKFVYLAATCGHPVTPSDEVDQAWHLHLVYTRSYWDELCGQVLGFALHHGPTKGGAAEGHKFGDWYAQTLHSYQAAFGSAPPADIWPPAAVRFGDAPHFRRVNMRGKWLLPRPRPRLPQWQWPRLTALRPALLALTGLLVLAGCTARTPLNPFNWYGSEFLGLFWGLCGTVLPLANWLRYRGRGPLEYYLGPLPSPYALARLAQRGRLVADSALAALAYGKHLTFPAPGQVQRSNKAAPTDAYERSIWQGLALGSPLADARKVGLSDDNAALRALDNELELAGLLLPFAERHRLNRLPLRAGLALGAFGGIKVLVGLNRDRPVGLLLLSLLGLAVATGVSVWHGAWATGQGAAVLRELTQRLARQRGRADGPNVIILAVAVLGVSSLRSLGLSGLATSLTPPDTSSADGSGGSGCGGGGCGGCGS